MLIFVIAPYFLDCSGMDRVRTGEWVVGWHHDLVHFTRSKAFKRPFYEHKSGNTGNKNNGKSLSYISQVLEKLKWIWHFCCCWTVLKISSIFLKFKGISFILTNISVTLFIVFSKFFPSNTQLFGTQFLGFSTKWPYTLITFSINFDSYTITGTHVFKTLE